MKKVRRPFGLKLEIFDPEDGSLLGGGSNRALVSKNASAGIKRATTTDPAALSLGAVREGGIEGKYRVSIFQGNQPLTHESFRSKKNAIAYAVDWKKRKERNIYGFSAKLRLRELARGEYLRRLIGHFEPVPLRGSAEAASGAGKLRYYRSNPAGKEIARVRREIQADPYLAPSSRFKDTPGLTVIDGYDEAHHFPKKSRQTKWVIDNLNKHAARGKSWSVAKGALGQPIVRAEGIKRILSAKLRLRELARGDYAIPALGKMLRDRGVLEEFLGRRRGSKLGDLRIIPHGDLNQGFVDKRDWGWVAPTDPTITQAARSAPNSSIGDPRMPGWARIYRAEVAKMIRKGRAGGDVYEEIL